MTYITVLAENRFAQCYSNPNHPFRRVSTLVDMQSALTIYRQALIFDDSFASSSDRLCRNGAVNTRR